MNHKCAKNFGRLIKTRENAS